VLRGFGRDVGYALRLFARNPGASLIAIFTLSLGIGANVALFGVVNAVLLKPLPFRDYQRLVIIDNTHPETLGNVSVSYPNFVDLREDNSSFEDMAAYSSGRRQLLIQDGQPDEITGVLVTPAFFEFMGVRPLGGRLAGGTNLIQAPING